MKSSSIFRAFWLVTLFVIIGGLARGDTFTITTQSGRIYKQCRIFRVYADGVMFLHKMGAAKIRFADMTSESREGLGAEVAEQAEHKKDLAERPQEQARIVSVTRPPGEAGTDASGSRLIHP